MSIARHHAEWLSLLEIAGPFLSMPALMIAFPQGLDAHDPDMARRLRDAWAEWQASQQGPRPDPSLHRRWIEFVLTEALGFDPQCVAQGQSIPPALALSKPEFGETVRPDLVIVEPAGRAAGSPPARLLIQVYPATQSLGRALPDRRWSARPDTRMFELLRATGVRLGLVTNGEQWMLAHAPPKETAGCASWYAPLWFDEPLTLRAFRALLGARRFFGVPDSETLEALLERSAAEQADVTDQLGDQVRHAVELLIQAIDRVNQERGGRLLAGVDEQTLYEAALTVMMRLVFLFSAEERDLLQVGDRALYEQNYAVGPLGAQLRALADQHGEEVMELRYDAWPRILATFRAVHAGTCDDRLRLPAYGSSLFDPDRYPFLEGRPAGTHWRDTPADPLPINNRVTLHLLDALQLLRMKMPGDAVAEPRRLSFRALDVTQIGPVYEGLLDHAARRATEPVLGLRGANQREPEVPLSRLTAFLDTGDLAGLIAFLKEETGRSESALRRALTPSPHGGKGRGEGRNTPVPEQEARLRAACGHDAALFERVRPFAALIRDDDYGRPVVILPGSVYVTQATTRRATGTHYTPADFADPIVRQTLEPHVYIGPADGLPPDQWRLRPPADLLRIRVCDMAMGSGAFLVQTCKYLADRLVEAWEAEEQGSGGAGEQESEGAGAQRSEGTEAQESAPLQSHIPDPKSKIPNPKSQHGIIRITPEGAPATGRPDEQLIPLDRDERLIFARRIVADRCLYGVDKNPMAVEIAKLSLWLVTMDRSRPFTFLDHALKCGDSLVGASQDDFERWAHSLAGASDASALTLYDEALRRDLDAALAWRRDLAGFDAQTPEDMARKQQLHQQAEAALARVRLGCDLLIGSRLLGLKPEARQKLQAALLRDYLRGETDTPDCRRALQAARRERAFHWPFEFPEVFTSPPPAADPAVPAGGGFTAIVGNPPFVGGQRISGQMGAHYLSYLNDTWHHTRGSADLCAYFFLRAHEHLRPAGTFGLIATNTIAQGDTRERGLEELLRRGATIYSAAPSVKWPGKAAVRVSLVHVCKGPYAGPKRLDGRPVARISALLDSAATDDKPRRLAANAGRSFIGSYVLGMGFVLTPEEAQALIARDPRNAEVLFPYLNGEDLNSRPDQSPSRWVINFFDWPLDKAAQYPDCLKIVRDKVKPKRAHLIGRNPIGTKRGTMWWQYGASAAELYRTIAPLKRVLAITLVSRTVAFAFAPSRMVFAHRLAVFPFDDTKTFALLQSSFHYHWAWKYSSTLKSDLNYAPSDCFETFPFPEWSDGQRAALEALGETYHETRRQIMLARQEGLTQTYNRFHDPRERSADIARLRALHVEMDHAVAAAYGWADLALGHGFHETAQGVRYTISPEARGEVLGRLLRLNHARYAAEVEAGLREQKGARSRAAKGAGGKPGRKPGRKPGKQPGKQPGAQPGLF